MNRLENKVAVITGACSGIGAATARRFAAEGAQLVLADVSDSQCDEVIASCGGGTNDRSNVEFVLTDVSKEADVIALIDAAIARFGRLDILFNNAGIGSFGTTATLATEDWDKILAVDLSSVFYGCKAAIPHLIAAGSGAVINTASVSGMRGDFNFAAYNAAKGAVVNYTRNLALDLGQYNIRVNAICPGLIETPLSRGLVQNAAVAAHYKAHHPMRRPGLADEVANVVTFLASAEASYVNGVILPVDGGLTASNGQPDFSSLLGMD